MSAAAIEIDGLTRNFGSVRAVDDLHLRVEQGEIFGFLGPNGAGKTTTIRLMLDLIRPTRGTVSILGFDCQRQSTETRRRTGYLPGDIHLYEGMTGERFLKFFASLRVDGVDPAYTRQLVDRFDLDLSREVRAYSKGNRQKLCLVQALMHQPELLLLDEPTSGLDPLMQHALWDVLKEVASSGHTVFFSSHVLSEVDRICQRVGIIRDGSLAAVEEVAQLRGRSLHIIQVTFASPVPADLFSIPGVELLDHDGATVRIRVSDGLDSVIKAIARHPIVDLQTQQPGLEEIFLAYYQSESRTEEGVRAAV